MDRDIGRDGAGRHGAQGVGLAAPTPQASRVPPPDGPPLPPAHLASSSSSSSSPLSPPLSPPETPPASPDQTDLLGDQVPLPTPPRRGGNPIWEALRPLLVTALGVDVPPPTGEEVIGIQREMKRLDFARDWDHLERLWARWVGLVAKSSATDRYTLRRPWDAFRRDLAALHAGKAVHLGLGRPGPSAGATAPPVIPSRGAPPAQTGRVDASGPELDEP